MGSIRIPENFLYSPILLSNVSDAKLDDRGRLTLPKELRERYGDHYHVVDLHDGIKLVPVAADPLDALREEFSDIERAAEELRERTRDVAMNEGRR